MNFFHRAGMLMTAVGIIALGAGIVGAAEQAPDGDKVATINGQTITRTELDQELQPVIQRMSMQGQQPQPEQVAEIREKVLDSLINRELLTQDAKDQGVTVEPEALDAQMEQIRGQFPEEAQFREALSQMGIDEETLRAQMHQRILIQKLIEERIAKDVTVTDEEAQAYYAAHPEQFEKGERLRARHILIKSEPDASDDDKQKARQTLEEVQGKLKKGESFADLAKEYSEGPSGPKGGDLGYFERGQMVKPFEDAAFALKDDEVSEIVETRFGFHLIKAVDRKGESTTEFAEVKDQIKSQLKRQAVQDAVGEYLEALRAKAEIERFN